jgi:putative ABC transport system permease protein
MDLLREAQLQPITVGGGPRDREALWFFDADNLMLSTQAARALGVQEDERLTLQVDLQRFSFVVKGTLPPDTFRSPVALMDIAAAQWRFGKLGRLSRIHVRVAQNADPRAVASALAARLPPAVKVTTPATETQQARQISRAFNTNLTALALVALFTGGFIVYSAQSLAVMRRRKELALLNALGVTRRQQRLGVLLLGTALGAVGAIAGVLLGAALADIGLQTFVGRVNARRSLPELQFEPIEAAVFVVLGIVVAVLGSLAPARAASRIPTAQALKAGNVEERGSHGHAYWGVALWTLAALVLLAPPIAGLPLPGYVSIALVLLGAVLLMPGFMRRVLHKLPDKGSVIYRTALAQLRGAASSSTLSVASILVSVSLMVAMSIMTHSLRTSYIDSIDRWLPADLYINGSRSTTTVLLDARTVAALQRVPGVERIETSRTIKVTIAQNQPSATVFARPIDVRRPHVTIPIESETSMPAPRGTIPIWISISLADRYDLEPGAQLRFTLGHQPVVGFVRGIWRDNVSVDSFVMPIDTYRSLSGDTRSSTVGIWVREGARIEDVMHELRTRLPQDVDLDIGLPSELRERALQAFDRIFAITYVLLAISVLIGLFGISVSASAQALARRAEFGVLRHLGFTRAQIGGVLALEGLTLGGLGMMGSLLVGSVISIILIHVVGRQSFYWSMELHIPWAMLLSLTVIVPLAAALTALASGRGAMGADVIRAVKEDW